MTTFSAYNLASLSPNLQALAEAFLSATNMEETTSVKNQTYVKPQK